MKSYTISTFFRFFRILLLLIAVGYVASLLAFSLTGFNQEHPLKPDLRIDNPWKFRLGDDAEWKKTTYDDTDWDTIAVPATWESCGYQYDGYAWYRTEIILPQAYQKRRLVILLGKIDDIDQLYINGKLISATGTFDRHQPQINGREWQEMRGYYVPIDSWETDRPNLIAIRVYDHGGMGGLFEGPVGIITQKNYIRYWRERKKRNH